MSSKFLYTLADLSQMEGLFNGRNLNGHPQPRIAMVGRSNVGKSTLLNALMGTQLARTSKQPGKTAAIHFYFWEKAQKILADLPGYGHADKSHDERNRWEKLIQTYMEEETQLEACVVLLDARHGPTPIDVKAIQFLSFMRIPVTFVFAKADTLKTQSQRVLRQREAALALKSLGLDQNRHYWVSSQTKAGLKELMTDLCQP